MTTTLTVRLPTESYEVVIGHGLIQSAGENLGDLVTGRRVAIVSDETVGGLYGKGVAQSLAEKGVQTHLVVCPDGETSKSFEGLQDVCDQLLALKLDRTDMILALGGGVVGDLAGFAASIYKRGVDYIQAPTTLLAQVDSSVGGKTAIDTPRGKNLIGAFHQPKRVLADLTVLGSLPARELRCGFAEIVKYGLLGDKIFFDWLERETSAVLALEPRALAHAVRRSVEMKAEIVAADERETGRRALLNLGHTFAHALESETGYGGELLHGEAVGAGLVLAFAFSAALGSCSRADSDRVLAAIRASGLPTRLADVFREPPSADRLMDHMAQDKKAQGGKLALVLARGIGDSFLTRDVDASVLHAFLVQQGAV